ncbi:MAG: class I SAM-dependent methyltransferase [Anaerolineaceae bacterium]|nr:class I SAM-dependent methyltransferase [Anaerolineaceae bacterium]
MPAMDYAKVAGWYDLYAATDLDVPFFLQECRGSHQVLELMAGTGRLSIPLLRAGVPLDCLDSSPDMLLVLRKKVRAEHLQARVIEMDVCHLDLPTRYDLILIPFNSFAEISAPADQNAVLQGVYRHLSPPGRLVCTLHNPAVRLKNIDGQLHPRGSYPLPDGSGRLVLSSIERYDPATHLVSGAQIYEIFDPQGAPLSHYTVPLKFYLHGQHSFESLAQAAGFSILALYGNYDRGAFDPDTSPFMIWSLARA